MENENQPPQNPESVVLPPSDAADSGATPPPPHQEGPTGVQEVSDTVGLMDGLGKLPEGFDPSVHAVDSAGNPVLRKGGGYARKRGRKPGEGGTPQPQIGASVNPPSAGAVSVGPKIGNDQAAKFLCANTEMFFMALFGTEWEITDEKEAKQTLAGVRSYLDATGGLDVSPAVGLAFTFGGYALPRLKGPETRSKLKQFADWCRGKLARK